jgi:hypothetical protein
MRHIPKLLKAGAFLVIISIFLPAIHVFENLGPFDLMSFIWYFGLAFASITGGGASESDIDFIDSDEYMTWGIAAIVLFIFAFILMVAAASKSKDENHKISAATGLLGGILAFIGVAEYYIGLRQEIPGYWTIADPSFGVYIPIIAGFLGIIGAIAAGYAFSLESKGELREKVPYQPTPDKMVIDKEPGVTSEEEIPVFCKNCGTKLAGEFCQECGQKAEFLIH